MPQETMGGQEGLGATNSRVIASGTTPVANGATVTLGTFTRRAGEAVTWGGWPVGDVGGLAVGASSGFTLWLERAAAAQQFTLRTTNASGADRSLEWWVRGTD